MASCIYKNAHHHLFLPMNSTFLEKDADTIYEELQDTNDENLIEDEYREDRMEQLISRYGY